jgi:hypothetical protein
MTVYISWTPEMKLDFSVSPNTFWDGFFAQKYASLCVYKELTLNPKIRRPIPSYLKRRRIRKLRDFSSFDNGGFKILSMSYNSPPSWNPQGFLGTMYDIFGSRGKYALEERRIELEERRIALEEKRYESERVSSFFDNLKQGLSIIEQIEASVKISELHKKQIIEGTIEILKGQARENERISIDPSFDIYI